MSTRNRGPRRRDILKGAALAGAAAAQERSERSTERPEIDYPRVFRGAGLSQIAFPLGGVGAGSISLGGRGQLRDWEIFNKPDKGRSPDYAFASIWVKGGAARPVARVLEARIMPPYAGSSGLGAANVPGLPRLESATFTGEFPLARIDFEDSALPVRVSLEAFTPLIPLDADASGLPVAVLRYRLTNAGRAAVNASVAFTLDSPVGTQGRTNAPRRSDGLAELFMTNPFQPAADPMAGSFSLAVLDAGEGLSWQAGWPDARWWNGPLLFWDDFSIDGALESGGPVKNAVGSLCVKREIPAGEHRDYTFLLAWHFPNRTPDRCGWSAPKGDEKTVIGNHYCQRFRNASEAVRYTAANLTSLEARTRAFVEAMRESTLPGPVRDAATANLSALVTPTGFRVADGSFHGFEGCDDTRGCCFGNCTHVWNYESALAHVFPSLSRSMRDSSFGFATAENGLMDFRQMLPDGRQHFGVAAADGQMGQIIKLYLDWRMCGDTEWLRRHWPAAKRAVAFAWIEGGWDANKDGVMEGAQHNTYDVEFYGPNPLCGAWYLGALRAAEEMARAVGDDGFARECHELFDRGSRWMDANLFNGEYYVQKVQGVPRDQIAKGLLEGAGAADTERPEFQVGDGCLLDQLVGQYLAEVAGLGPLLDTAHIRATLEAIWRYNYRRNLYEHESVQRTYALNDEPALIVCGYAPGKRPQIPFPYFAEVWTGQEYSVAALMIWHGMVDRGVEVVSNCRRRYDGERRNPWNEPECGHQYVRPMSSWAPLAALSGFRYHAADRVVEAKPRINVADFRCLWFTGTGWGTFRQTVGEQNHFALRVTEGTLAVRSLELDWKPARPVSPVTLHAGEELAVTS